MHRFVNAVLAGAVALSLPIAADAADLGRGGSIKDAPPPPREEYAEPFYNWQGLYAGAFVGGGSEDGVAVGGWLGYNFMLSNRFVLGVEADVGKANADQSDDSDLSRVTIDTFGSLRARYGYAIDRFLVYGTPVAFCWVTVILTWCTKKTREKPSMAKSPGAIAMVTVVKFRPQTETRRISKTTNPPISQCIRLVFSTDRLK